MLAPAPLPAVRVFPAFHRHFVGSGRGPGSSGAARHCLVTGPPNENGRRRLAGDGAIPDGLHSQRQGGRGAPRPGGRANHRHSRCRRCWPGCWPGRLLSQHAPGLQPVLPAVWFAIFSAGSVFLLPFVTILWRSLGMNEVGEGAR